MRLGELAARNFLNCSGKSEKSSAANLTSSAAAAEEFLDISQAFSDFSGCSSDISGELQRLACLPSPRRGGEEELQPEPEPCFGFLQRESFSTEIIESISPEDLQPMVKICVEDRDGWLWFFFSFIFRSFFFLLFFVPFFCRVIVTPVPRIL
ncbi:unnamed protein product [Linum tenue]|nr:unnamed protein product [Linum tenue]